MVLFGPSGNSESFYEKGYKHSVQMPGYLAEMGLDAYEYSCTKGVKLKRETALELRAEAEKHNIVLSVHSPYYINLATDDEEKREKSIKYITDTAAVADAMGAGRIVVHSGACAKMEREVALEYAKKSLILALKELDNLGLGHVHICPETMGKANQLGTLDEVMELCLLDDRLIPTIDFGHLYARNFGALVSKKEFEDIFDTIENKLGSDRLKSFHSHFSRIEYTTPGGEKRHTIYDDSLWGPDFDICGELIYKKNLSPTIICESAGTMAEDALKMKQIYNNLSK
ncbi:MAG: TIM barrel protein [Monoglobales bacterium]